MEPDTTLLNALRRTYDTRPTGFSTDRTITYSVLSPASPASMRGVRFGQPLRGVRIATTGMESD